MAYPPFNPWQNAPFGQTSQNAANALRMQQQAMLEQQQNKLRAMQMARDLGRLISMRRNSSGFTHDQLAELSGVGAYEIIQIESGGGAFISMEKYLAVMAALRLNISSYPF